MNGRSKTISKLRSNLEARYAYISAKLSTIVPSQIRALRLKSDMPRQSDLAQAAKMQQSRISMFETPGAANLTLETLGRIAAALKVGLVVKFVPFSEMLDWENNFSQDQFDVVKIDRDWSFLHPTQVIAQPTPRNTFITGNSPVMVGVNQFAPANGTRNVNFGATEGLLVSSSGSASPETVMFHQGWMAPASEQPTALM